MLLLTDPPPARVSEAIRCLNARGFAHAVPLFRAVLAGEIALAALAPGERIPLSALDPTRLRRPLVVLLGGDGGADGRTSVGPEAWSQARRLLLWSRWTMIHAAGGEAWHYAHAAESARYVRRVLIAECGSATLPAWLAMRDAVAPSCPGLVVQCRPGDHHPKLPAEAAA